MKNLLNLIEHWMEFSIENQEELKLEHKGMPFPEWNKGYLDCLYDLKKIIEGKEKE